MTPLFASAKVPWGRFWCGTRARLGKGQRGRQAHLQRRTHAHALGEAPEGVAEASVARRQVAHARAYGEHHARAPCSRAHGFIVRPRWRGCRGTFLMAAKELRATDDGRIDR